MKTIIVWIIIVIGELSGICLIFAGLKRKKHGSPKFRIMHFFKNIPMNEHSGMQLIFEGIGAMLSGLLLYYAFFLW